MNYATLYNELTTDPLARGYATMTDAQAAASLNTADRSVIRPRLANAKTVMHEIENGWLLLDKLEAAAPSVPPVKWALKFLETDVGIDVGSPVTQAQLQSLVPGVLTQAEADALKALAQVTVSRADELGLGAVGGNDVAEARRLYA